MTKLSNPAFREDIRPLLRDGADYNFDAAAKFMLDEVVSKLPGDPWKGCAKVDDIAG